MQKKKVKHLELIMELGLRVVGLTANGYDFSFVLLHTWPRASVIHGSWDGSLTR